MQKGLIVHILAKIYPNNKEMPNYKLLKNLQQSSSI